MIKVKDQITITIDIALAKELMRLLANDTNEGNLNPGDCPMCKEKEQLFDAIGTKLGGKRYEKIESHRVFDKQYFNDLPILEQMKKIFNS